jgi:putative sporulation protein YtaF
MIYGMLLALSLNLDSFGIGITYGMKKIKVPFSSLLMINLISILFFTAAYGMGFLLLRFIHIAHAKILSAAIIIFLGIVFYIQAYLDCKYPPEASEKTITTIPIKVFGIVINIIRDPSSGDRDHSGVIDIKEAIYIGTALAIDAFAVGLAVCIANLHMISFITTAFISNLTFFGIGNYLGIKLVRISKQHTLKYLSAIILIFLGLLRLI